MNSNNIKVTVAICLCSALLLINCPVHSQHVDDPNFGYMSQGTAGTISVSGVSASNVQMNWISMEGPIPEVEMALNYEGSFLKNGEEIRNG